MSRRVPGFVIASVFPGLILYVVLVLIPFAQTVKLAFYRFSGVSTNREFVGLGNYRELWTSDSFWWAVRNAAVMLVIVAPITLALSMALAHACAGNGRQARFLRSIYLFPNLISVVAAALIWRSAVNPSVGLLRGLGLEGPSNGWLGDTETAFVVFAVAFVWTVFGFYTMLFSAGLAGIPQEVAEAANLDGARGLSRYFHVTRPLLWPVRRVAAVHLAVATLGVFGLVNVMTDGEPSNRTQSLLNVLYRAMTIEGSFGQAAAIGTVAMAATAFASIVLWFGFRRNPAEGAR